MSNVTLPENTKKDPLDTMRLLVDDLWGINIPKRFIENFDLKVWGLNPKDYESLKDGDSDDYWDVWGEAVADAIFTDEAGHEWKLYHDEGLWAVREDHEWEGEDYVRGDTVSGDDPLSTDDTW